MESVGNRRLAIIGYKIIATIPKTVILAIANTTSFFLADMVGANAIIALAPQILVPTAINDAIVDFSPNPSAILFVIISVIIIQGITIEKLLNPKSSISTSPSRIPINTIPNLSTYLMQKRNPNPNLV